MKNSILILLLLLSVSWACNATIDIEYRITEVANSKSSYGLSVRASASDSKQLVPYWHRKAKEICGSQNYKNSQLIKKETQCGDALRVNRSGQKCEVIRASVFGTLRCESI